MKTILFKLSVLALAVLALAGGFPAGAQSTPGETDYGRFSQFIADRNIFDPNRFPHETHTSYHPRTRYTLSAPEFTLAGTMNYGKGWFAFFDSNNSDLRQVLPVSGAIAGYTVTNITLGEVAMVGPDKKVFTMKLGQQMQHGNNGWQLITDLAVAGTGGASAAASDGASVSGSGATTSPSSLDGSVPAPSSTLGSSDVLKRLMQLRQQENK